MSEYFEVRPSDEPAQRLQDPIPVRGAAMEWVIPAGPVIATGNSPAPAPAGPRARRTAGGGAAVVAALVLTAVVAFVVGGSLQTRSTPNTVGVATPSSPSSGDGSSSSSSSSSSSAAPGRTSTTALFNGIVDINTELGYQGGRAAGTGMVLTSSGEVLTNNHVINGATQISATAVDTGRTYTAHVVGTDPTDDVAVVQLDGASRLSTVTTASSANVEIGDPVIAAGNAGGRGGTPSVVKGNVVALGQTITASDENGSHAEQLTDLIAADAPIEPGDSGGPLFNDSGEVIGMNSAADASGSGGRTAATYGYAIRIDKALSIADKIESGKASATIHIGLPAFLGVQIADSPATAGAAGRLGPGTGLPTGGGAPVAGVEDGTPAADIGLSAGDTITAVNGHTVSSAAGLSPLLRTARPGDKVTIDWVDASGSDHSARATLTTGPAD